MVQFVGTIQFVELLSSRKHLKYSRIIKFSGIDMELRKTRNRTRVKFPKKLKELIVHEMKEVDNARNSKPVTQRGHSALERYGCPNDEFKWSVERDLDKSITIWHIATDICYHSSNVQYGVTNSQIEMGILLSSRTNGTSFAACGWRCCAMQQVIVQWSTMLSN